MVKDPSAWQGWSTRRIGPAGDLASTSLRQGESVVLDFGRHMVGYLSGKVAAPAKLRFEAAEVPAELCDRWEDHPAIFGNGFRPKRGWSPDDAEVTDNWRLSRRHALRYLRITVLAAEKPVILTNLSIEEVSAVPLEAIRPLEGFDERLRRIDLVSQHTLRNCMHEVFEDGPKRDRRLWLGDLRLQARLDALTFRSFDLVKRCLLLHAACVRDDGFIPACVFTPPDREPHIGDEMIPDYAMLFGPTLLDYCRASGDKETGTALYPLARRQVELVCERWLGSSDLLEIPAEIWCFIDWCDPLDRQAAEQATAIYSLRALEKLADLTGNGADIPKLEALRERLSRAARAKLLDPASGLFVSGKNRQISSASQIWMILAGVVDPAEGADILRRLAAHPDAVRPGSPYLAHHLVEAHLVCGMDAEAHTLLRDYWGGMLDRGADTFWEVHDPKDDRRSPYRSHLFNSYCHAWSCTPGWFLRHPEYGPRLKAAAGKL